MPASRHLNPNQLKLFATAREIMDFPAGDSGDDDESEWGASLADSPALAKRKLLESKTGTENEAETRRNQYQESLHDSIRKHGVITPVLVQQTDVGNTWLLNGHHRVTTAYDINPDMYIPLSYTEDMWDPQGWSETGREVTPEMKAKTVRKNA